MKTQGYSLCMGLLLLLACHSQEQKSASGNTLSEGTENTQVTESVAASGKHAPTSPKEEDTEAIIAQIRKQFRDTEAALAQASGISLLLIPTEAEEQAVTAYLKDGQVIKISVETAMGHEGQVTHYYLKNGIPYFVFERQAAESSATGPFSITENRFYLHNHKLIRTLFKQKQFKGDEQEINMDDAPVKDITALDESPEGTAQAFEKRCQAFLEYIQSIRQLQGTWQSTEDTKSSLVIQDAYWQWTYEGVPASSNDRLQAQYQIAEGGDLIEQGDGLQIILRDASGGNPMRYILMPVNKDTLKLIYLSRGNILTFVRKQ